MHARLLVLSGFVAFLGVANACWPKNNKTEQSEIDAITAESRRLFGNNVRGYMWALTTDTPAGFAQAPSGIAASARQPVTIYDPFANSADEDPSRAPQSANASPIASLPTISSSGKSSIPVRHGTLDLSQIEFFQCWYYAETPAFVKLEGDALKALFMDKSKTRKVNNNFVDIRYISQDIQKSEQLRTLESFALGALPGTCFLLSSVGPLKGSAKGALSNAVCSLGLASLSNLRKLNDGWGSDKARLQIQNQLKARADQLEEVNWDVLLTLKNRLSDFNTAQKFQETTQVQCPSNEAWVAELMGGQ
ncbi:hypothetical protein EBU99_02640 [bacterium]|nr:hypothetical protein [bacterium]